MGARISRTGVSSKMQPNTKKARDGQVQGLMDVTKGNREPDREERGEEEGEEG
jgi:hypothetical protein